MEDKKVLKRQRELEELKNERSKRIQDGKTAIELASIAKNLKWHMPFFLYKKSRLLYF